MKRIIDIDGLQEAQQRQKKQKTYWQRIKNDPVKFGHYRRKQYVNKKKEALSPVVAAVPFEKIREYNMSDNRPDV